MSYLEVPGARLYYEVHGNGPPLLLIAGGTDDCRDFTGVIPPLAASRTIVTYDCRGISRSRLDRPAAQLAVSDQAEDARRVITAVADRADVFGSSSGAQIALALAARHPGLVGAVVAHEPPAVGLLPPGDPRRRLVADVHDRYRREGTGSAMREFVERTGMRQPRYPARTVPESRDAAARVQERLLRMSANLPFFLDSVLVPATSYVPDADALRAAGTAVAVGVGDASEGQLAWETAAALARLLGIEPVTFPGGHAGFVSHPERFAATLREVLAARLVDG